MFQQLINPIKLNPVTNFLIRVAEQNILQTLSFCTQQRNKVSPKIRKSVSYQVFKNSLLTFIRLSPNSLCNVSDSLGIKLLTRLRSGLSHLREHKFNHNFQDTINPICSCSLESESTIHFFLRCQNFKDFRECLMNEAM